jgi:hypothetical protein
MSLRGKDGAAPITMAAERQCARRMPRGMAKRYPFTGQLIGYVICCPGCGNSGTHVLEDASGFKEVDGKLDACSKPLICAICDRVLSIAGGVIMAVLPKAEEPCRT